MKARKILSFFVLTVLISALLLVPVSAKDNEINVSRDLSYAFYNGEKYIRVDPADIWVVNSPDFWGDISFEGGDAHISYSSAYAGDEAIELWVGYTKGGSASYYYIKESLIPEFNSLRKDGGEEYVIEFFHDQVSVSKKLLFGKELTIRGYEKDEYIQSETVLVYSPEKSYCISSGYLMHDIYGNFYYVDYEGSTTDPALPLNMQENIKIWQITDADTLADFRSNSGFDFEEYDDIEFEEDGFLVGAIFFILLLGVLPLVCGIIAFILSFKSTKQYKLRLRIIAALCVATATIAVVTVIICGIL